MKYIYLAAALLVLVIGGYTFVNNNLDTNSTTSNEANTNTQNATTLTAGDTFDTMSAIQAAAWAEGISITYDETANQFRYESNGIPDHGFAEQYLIPNNVADPDGFSNNSIDQFTAVDSAEYFSESPVDTTITTNPVYSATVTETSLGRIGVMLSGAQLFNDYENMERTVVALDDNTVHDHAAFVDDCNGHTLAEGTDYHYHGIPTCITDLVDVPGQHSTMIGILEDGFPVYGNKDEGGIEITNEGLDECSGHYGATPEFPNGIYHYHLTADEAPYSVDCYHGEYNDTDTNRANPGGPPPMGGPGQAPGGPDFAQAAVTLGVSETELMAALGTSVPPDLETAAATLGITVAELQDALGPPPQR